MGKKYCSVIIKGIRVEFEESDIENINKSVTTTTGGRKFVHLFTKDGRVDILKEEFDKAINLADTNSLKETGESK